MTVHIPQLPIRTCPTGIHAPWWAVDEFNVLLHEHIWYDRQFPTCKSTRWNRRVCHACRTSVARLPVTRGQVRGWARVANLDRFEVIISGRIVRCGRCSAEQIFDGDDEGLHLDMALTAAFKSVGLDRIYGP